MKNFDGLFGWDLQGAAEDTWCPGFYRELAARRAFRAARRDRFLGRLLGLAGLAKAPFGRKEPEAFEAEPGRRPLLPLDHIVGVRTGDSTRPLPLIPSSAWEAWVRMYLAEEAENLVPLRVYRGARGYYLEDEARLLLALGVLKARGVRAVRAEVKAESPNGKTENCCGNTLPSAYPERDGGLPLQLPGRA